MSEVRKLDLADQVINSSSFDELSLQTKLNILEVKFRNFAHFHHYEVSQAFRRAFPVRGMDSEALVALKASEKYSEEMGDFSSKLTTLLNKIILNPGVYSWFRFGSLYVPINENPCLSAVLET